MPLHERRTVTPGELGSHLSSCPQSPTDAIQLDTPSIRNAAAIGQVAGLEQSRLRLHSLQEVHNALGIGGVPGTSQRRRRQRGIPRPHVTPRRAPSSDRDAVRPAQYMQVEKCQSHHVTVESTHLRDGPGGKPGGLFAREVKTVRHSGEHPAARDQGIGSSDFDKCTARADGDSGRVQREWSCRDFYAPVGQTN